MPSRTPPSCRSTAGTASLKRRRLRSTPALQTASSAPYIASPDRLHVLLSLAGHLFDAHEYGKAADLNLEIGLRFHHRDDHDTALLLTERAIISAEHLEDDALLAAAKRQRDLIRQRASGPLTAGR